MNKCVAWRLAAALTIWTVSASAQTSPTPLDELTPIPFEPQTAKPLELESVGVASGRPWINRLTLAEASSMNGTRHWIALSLLVVVLAGVAYWKRPMPTNDLAEIDTGLLTDELPINAYLDKGFDSWLKRPSR